MQEMSWLSDGGLNGEIGLSVKHSRLSKNLYFGSKWYGIDCSKQYWEDIKPIFEYLDVKKQKDSKWSDYLIKKIMYIFYY